MTESKHLLPLNIPNALGRWFYFDDRTGERNPEIEFEASADGKRLTIWVKDRAVFQIHLDRDTFEVEPIESLCLGFPLEFLDYDAAVLTAYHLAAAELQLFKRYV